MRPCSHETIVRPPHPSTSHSPSYKTMNLGRALARPLQIEQSAKKDQLGWNVGTKMEWGYQRWLRGASGGPSSKAKALRPTACVSHTDLRAHSTLDLIAARVRSHKRIATSCVMFFSAHPEMPGFPTKHRNPNQVFGRPMRTQAPRRRFLSF